MIKISEYHFSKVKKYFDKNYPYLTILHMMKKKYGLVISLRSLNRIFKKNGLKRKNLQESSREDVIIAIKMELAGSGFNLGYRSMWKRLFKVYGLVVKQKTVLEFLREVDPAGVERRCRYRLARREYYAPGPNWIYHVDGHDKLKRYGFAVYGGMDGFSRKIVWLYIATTNNNPEVIAYYYLKSIEKFGFTATLIRADNGTEACIMEDCHKFLRYKHSDDFAGINSFLRGKSTHNQRIESYWRQFREKVGDFYINLFRSMEHENNLDVKSKLHIECLRFCFGELIQQEILWAKKEWNEHRVRNMISRNKKGGIPNERFHWPEKFGAEDYKIPVNQEHVKYLLENYAVKPQLYSPEFEELVNLIMPNVKKPTTAEDAYYLYFDILDAIDRQKNTCQ